MNGLLAVVSILTLAVGASAQALPPARAARALLVGCTEYPYLKEAGSVPGSNTIELRGPTNDVELFARALRDVYGVPDAAMAILTGWPADERARPTKANIERGFRRLAADAQPGDWVVVYLAGHGSQQPSSAASLDDEPDGLDEIFLPADARPAADGARVPNALVDDEIAVLTAAIRAKGAEVWLVVDACHSGTLLRGGGWTVRGLPPSALGVRGATPRPLPGVEGAPAATSARASKADGITAFYGAQSFGSAPEMELPPDATDARPHGLFTYLLAKEMHRVGASATYGELMQRVVAAYQAFPCFLTVPMAQGDLDRAVGGGGRVADPPILVAFGSGAPRLDQGLLAGIERGTVLAVVADGAALDSEPMLELEVVETGIYDAECRLRSGVLPESSITLRARVTTRPVGEFTLALRVESPTGARLPLAALPATVRAFLATESGHFRVVEQSAEADWRIVVDGERLHLRAADRVGAHDVLDAEPGRVPVTLGRIRRALGMRRVCGLFGAPDPTLAVWVERRARGADAPVRLAAGDRIAPGDEVRVLLHKSGGGIVDANVYFLDANHGIERFFPRGAQSPRLEPKADTPLELVPWTRVTDDALGVESLWVLAVPRGPSDPVLALRDLSQDPTTTRGVEAERATHGLIAELLSETRTRGLAAGSDQPARAGGIFQVPLHTAWPTFGPPAWRSAEPARSTAAHPFLGDLPLPFEAGPCFEFASSPAAAGGVSDLLLLGDLGGPRAVLVDFDPVGSRTDPGTFEPEAAFLFLPDGRRLALYDRRDRGAFDLALLDADGDGDAEARWTRDAGKWILQEGVRTPWLSQAHLTASVLGAKKTEVATARLSAIGRVAYR